ncbi:hypothetical protein L873DRAFT_886086 [Choiromyces venosus 120613-1]|uniref:Uncharacterized protein n=1 Tax=Choiromyces venosus 120613-1 TaxID=1336337 RepID=A0A3N4ITM3_9PEZI|nr:hypothetical protein L873DRAFT_886086 [Choiromyces venosus 120613-1]
MLSHKVMLSCQALSRVPPVVSQQTCRSCGHMPQPWHDYQIKQYHVPIYSLAFMQILPCQMLIFLEICLFFLYNIIYAICSF